MRSGIRHQLITEMTNNGELCQTKSAKQNMPYLSFPR